MARTSKSFPVAKHTGEACAKMLGDRKLKTAIYRLAPRNPSNKFGLCGLLLKQEGYGAEYAKKLCVCGRELSFGRLTVYSNGMMAPRLVHFGCAQKAMTWARLTMINGPIVLGPSYYQEKEIALVDMAPIWASYNSHLPSGDEEIAEAAKDAVAEAIEAIAS